MTQPHSTGPAQAPPFAAMLGATVIPMVVAVPLIVVVFWITRQSRGGLAALLGAGITVVFLAGGLALMSRVTNANPLSVLAGALGVYLGQVIFLGVVVLSLSGAHWLDGTAFGLAIVAVVLIWQVCQVVAFLRLRLPLYDAPAGEPTGVSADEPAQRRLA